MLVVVQEHQNGKCHNEINLVLKVLSSIVNTIWEEDHYIR